MPAPPYWHVETTPFGLTSDLGIGFTRDTGGSAAVVKRHAERCTLVADAHYDMDPPTWAPDVQPAVRGAMVEGSNPPQYHWKQQRGHADFTWVPTEYSYQQVDYYVNVVDPALIQSGDAIVSAWARYVVARAAQRGTLVTPKGIGDLPVLPEGLSYGASTPLTFTVSATSNPGDFAPGNPVSAEPKGLCGVGYDPDNPTRTLLTALRLSSPPLVTDPNDLSDEGALRFVQDGESDNRVPTDGQVRVFNAQFLGETPPDGGVSGYTGALSGGSPWTVSLLPATGGASAFDLHRTGFIHSTNPGTALYKDGGNLGWNGSRGLPAQSVREYQQDPDFGDGRRGYWYYEWIGGATDDTPPFNALITFDQPLVDTSVMVEKYPAIDGGPAPATPPAGVAGWTVALSGTGTVPEERSLEGFSAVYPAAWATPVASFTKRAGIAATATLWQFFLVTEDAEPPPEGGITDPLSALGLCSVRNVFGLTRQVVNVGFASQPLRLRRSYDLDATFDTVDLGLSGVSPDLLALQDGSLLLAYSDRTNVALVRFSDEGSFLAAMPSPGPGKLVTVFSSMDPEGPVWCAVCTKETGTGALLNVYRTFDPHGLTGWGPAVTVVTGVPAQKPCLAGDLSLLQLWYHDGTTVRVKVSRDSGATWTDA